MDGGVPQILRRTGADGDVPLAQIPLKVMAGERPVIPRDWPREWAELMGACWHNEPERRPTFKEVVRRLERIHKTKAFEAHDMAEASTFGGKGRTPALHTRRCGLGGACG